MKVLYSESNVRGFKGDLIMRKLIVIAALFALALTGSAFSQTADEVILLTQKGVGEDVLVAFVEASQAPVALSVADIAKLKDAKVPDKVIVTMLHRQPADRVSVASRAAQQTESKYQARSDNSQASVEYQPAPQRVVEVPSATYVYSGYPYSYGSSYYYPGYYPYYYPSVSLGFGFGSFGHHGFAGGHGFHGRR
jgi:hypothetical protein